MKAFAQVLLIVLVSACGTQAGTADDGREAIRKATKYLWSKQAADGGWRSETYGLLKSGQSLTPFILLALLDAPEARKDGVDRALAFIRATTNPMGEVGRSDPTLEDYPNFATSLAVRALIRAGKQDGVDRMVEALRRQQFSEQNGWKPEDPAYGAWGMGGPLRTPPHTGHVDLCMTRHVMQVVPDCRALNYVERCQNPDGGFLFSTVILDANKAGTGRSYGTATADGVLALLAAGVKSTDKRVVSAIEWLTKHHRVDGVPGFDESTAKWREGMIYYYLAASAQAFKAAGSGPAGWQQELIQALKSRQREDGSFKSPTFLMKEDDPLIATTFALLALIAAT